MNAAVRHGTDTSDRPGFFAHCVFDASSSKLPPEPLHCKMTATGIESIIDLEPVAAYVKEIMAERSSWTGSAADLLRAGAGRSGSGTPWGSIGWPKNPRALAGRLRRAQTFLRAVGI